MSNHDTAPNGMAVYDAAALEASTFALTGKTEPAKVFTYEHDFPAFIQARDEGGVVEIDAEMFDYWLEVLPPVGGNVEQNGESIRMTGMGGQWVRRDGSRQYFSFLFAEGWEPMTAFWITKWHGQLCYFCQLTHIINPQRRSSTAPWSPAAAWARRA